MTQKADYGKEGVVALMDQILASAVGARASDIHLDPGPESLTVRFRIDGLLYPFQVLPVHYRDELISLIKVLSKMDIGEHGLPQDGHLEFDSQGRIYNLRISTIPTIHGEAVAFRVLNKDDIIAKLGDLGFDPDQLEVMRRLIASPHGMILITGPTGSGKTTVLYSLLDVLKQPNRNIITIEDPIELEMPGIRQLQINEAKGLTFTAAARAVLRQNPDIIMFGEIRDPDTAQMAFRAAFSGVLVFSTFHTFDIASLVIRLIEMGIPRSVLSSGVTAVLSTRLVRKVCAACAEPHELGEAEKSIFQGQPVSGNFRKGKGCPACNGSGYAGRTGLFEILPVDEEIRVKIIEGKSKAHLREFFREKTKKTLREHALSKVVQGVTTADEVMRILGMP